VRIARGELTLNLWEYGERRIASFALEDVGAFTHRVSVTVRGQKIAVYLDGKNIINRDIPMGNISGKVGFRITEENYGITDMSVKKL